MKHSVARSTFRANTRIAIRALSSGNLTGMSPTNADLAAFGEFLATVLQPEHNVG
jgi:hypothetical protein